MLRASNRRRIEALMRASKVVMESLEPRILFSLPDPSALPNPNAPIPTPILPTGNLPLQGVVGTPLSLSPQMINTGYGFNNIYFNPPFTNTVIQGNGAGQTIAIIDAYGSPTLRNDVQTFDSQWGISDRDSTGHFFLSIQPLFPGQNTTSAPADVIAGWALETSLDVEWAHAIAPGAHILLVVSPSASRLDMIDSDVFAMNWDTVTQTEEPVGGPGGRGVSVISDSWGEPDFNESFLYDGFLNTPLGHQSATGILGGVSIFVASGDTGGVLQYPAASENVIAVGGITSAFDLNGNLILQAPWTGSGGGTPNYAQAPGEPRHNPLVSLDADPNSGVWVFDSSTLPAGTQSAGGWSVVGGTSFAAPGWAAYMSIVDQGRNLEGLPTLFTDQSHYGDGLGDSATFDIMYFGELNANPFNPTQAYPPNSFPLWGMNPMIVPDPTKVPNKGNTGFGSPVVSVLTNDLLSQADEVSGIGYVAASQVNHLAFSVQPGNGIAGQTLPSVTVSVTGGLSTGTITLSISSFSPSGLETLFGTLTANVVAGQATFNNLSMDIAGTYQFQAIGPNAAPTLSASFNVVAAAPVHLGFVQQPTSNWVDGVLLPPIQVGAEDQFNNVSFTASDTVTLSILSGPAGGIILGSPTETMVGGVATFGGISFNIAGVYTLLATDDSNGGINPITSNAFTVAAPDIHTFLFSSAPLSAAMLAFQERRNAAVLVATGVPVPTVLSNVAPAIISSGPATPAPGPSVSNVVAAQTSSPFSSGSLISDTLSSTNDQDILSK